MKVTSPWDGDVRAQAFYDFVLYAARHLMWRFEEDCGPVDLGSGPLDAMIDKSTGRSEHESQRFVDWCVEQFGTPEQVDAEDPEKEGPRP